MPLVFGERLRALRQAAGLTQEELADRSGMTAAGISAIERGVRTRTYPRTVNALADALGLAGDDRDEFRALVPRPWRSVTASGSAGALPGRLTEFIGRGRERARLRRLLDDARLVTLVGPGGIGKTRLAVEVAAASPEFPAGVRMADLGPVLDAGLVAYTVARSVGLIPRPPGSPLAAAGARIGDARLLLVLDNCEHVVQAAAEAAAWLLERCPRLAILATSREPLRVPGEVVVQVGPLTSGESAALLAARVAASAGPGMCLARDGPAQLLLARLDGMPLAIELAAAALRVFTSAQILAQLDASLGSLMLGSRVALPRHRSLDAAIGWSYELLAPDERRLWRRLSVFVGGFELDAAVDVCRSPELPAQRVPAVLAALVDKSVVQRDERGRFRMLEPMRGYGRRLLSADGEEAALEQRHRDWAAALAWPRPEVFWGPQEPAWRDRFEREQANLRAALAGCADAGEARTGLAIFTGLYGLWQTRAGSGEGLRWFDTLIALDGPEDDIRALALCWAVWMRTLAGDLAGAIRAGREAERIARKISDPAALGSALQNLAFTYLAARRTRTAIDLAAQAVEWHRRAGNEFGVAGALHHLAYAHQVLGDRPRSRELAEEALGLCEAAGNRKFSMAISVLLALLAWQDGEVPASAALAADAIAAAGRAGDQWNIARALQLLGWAAAATGQAGRAATLFGAAQALLDSIQDDSDLARLPPHPEAESRARLVIGEASYARLYAEGYGMSASGAIRYALAPEPAGAPALGSRAAIDRRGLGL